MTMEDYPHELLEDTRELASYCGWSDDVYQDFLACQRGTLSFDAFHQKYQQQSTILVIDMTGFTTSAMKIGELQSLLRVLDGPKRSKASGEWLGCEKNHDATTNTFEEPATRESGRGCSITGQIVFVHDGVQL